MANLDVHPQLEVQLFAAEPMLLSPSNIDIDARGRVWVCEIVNYRAHRDKRPEGDRILILEDTDGDGRADQRKVFYQGADIDSPHGVCVLGNRVIVSAGSQVLCFTDEDGDDQPDRKEVWFSGISGVQHDHGIHTFLFGPDGKLYFNFGNEGKQILDADGQPIIDMAGNVVEENLEPYQQGMVFRCNPDLSDFETLGWNFRNNWMVTVDSFGTLWQSDNDDDGNRAVRINYVMEFGNFGYRDEFTAAGWRAERVGMAQHIPTRHWHQNDPGVVPNLLLTGAGSPTGITVYEGDALIDQLKGQLIHCDAGPSVTRAYLIEDDGAGYSARILNLLEGQRDPWFRPSDVQVAPDGSLIVADWYDPGVGGHHMRDLQRGRLFRVTAAGQAGTYVIPQYDYTTASGGVEALKNASFSVRYLAWTALHRMGRDAEPALRSLSQDDSPVLRARAFWLLGKIPGRGRHYVDIAASDPDARIRGLAVRLARQLTDVDTLKVVEGLVNDDSPQVRRECAIALRGNGAPQAARLWSQLAQQLKSQDRWYLEALGIAANGQWDRFLKAWMDDIQSDWNQPAGRQIVWRSRAKQSPELLRQILEDPDVPRDQLAKYVRALDFLRGPELEKVLLDLAFDNSRPDEESRHWLQAQAVARLDATQLQLDANQTEQLNALLDRLRGTSQFVDIVRRLRLTNRHDDLARLAIERAGETEGIAAARLLLAAGQAERFREYLSRPGSPEQLQAVEVLGRSADNRALGLLMAVMQDEVVPSETRRAAVGSLAGLRAGAEYLADLAAKGTIPADLASAVAAQLHQSPWRDLQSRAKKLFPVLPSKDNKPVSSIRELVGMTGDAEHGSELFRTTGTCAKCHKVDGQGTQVGPDLSEIGDKLSREALFESIIYPSAGISHNYETYTAALADGNVVIGLILNQTDAIIEIQNDEGLVRRIPQADVEELVKQPTSLMPADIHQALTEQDLVDIVEYLTTLKK